MKDGRTHLAHKAEHAVDLETGAVVGVTVQGANAGDTTTMVETLITTAGHVEAVLPAGGGVAELVADKGYHSNETLVALADLGLRSYVSEPDRGRGRWRGNLAACNGVDVERGLHAVRDTYVGRDYKLVEEDTAQRFRRDNLTAARPTCTHRPPIGLATCSLGLAVDRRGLQCKTTLVSENRTHGPAILSPVCTRRGLF